MVQAYLVQGVIALHLYTVVQRMYKYCTTLYTIIVIALLKDALPLPANKGGAIKEKIKQALAILD